MIFFKIFTNMKKRKSNEHRPRLEVLLFLIKPSKGYFNQYTTRRKYIRTTLFQWREDFRRWFEHDKFNLFKRANRFFGYKIHFYFHGYDYLKQDGSRSKITRYQAGKYGLKEYLEFKNRSEQSLPQGGTLVRVSGFTKAYYMEKDFLGKL